MPVVNVRLPEEDLEFLAKRGMDVGRLVRSALHERLEWMRFEEAQAGLKEKSFGASRPGARMVREDRDHVH